VGDIGLPLAIPASPKENAMTQAQAKYLYLPVEIWVREFHAKTLLAVQAAARGWTVVIGPKSEMDRRLPTLPQGTVFQFGFHKNFASAFERLRSYGHKIVAVDEEGLVTLNPEHYKRFRVSSETLDLCDACFCWGSVHRDMIFEVNKEMNGKLHVTGSPRIDLLRPEFRDLVEREARPLREQYGRFLLVNGNFGSYNHAMGIDYTWKSLESKGWTSTAKDADFHRRRVELQGRFFTAFHEVIPKLVEAGHKVVVRPHPSESIDPWQKLAEQCGGRVVVSREGNVVPWLQAAEAVLHNGCTTAVEAFVLGRPVVAFRPEQIPELETKLPNHLSLQVSSEEELLALVAKVVEEDRESRKERSDYVENYLVGLEGALASERMVRVLPEARPNGDARQLVRFGDFFRSLIQSARGRISLLIHRQTAAYVGLKCGQLDLQETRLTVADFSRRLEIERDLPVSSIGNGLLCIG
jgi:surface carbohydrate biosynthesis protein